MRLAGFLIGLTAVATLGAAVEGFQHWPLKTLQEWNGKLAADMKGTHSHGTELGKFGNHQSAITRRDADGTAELHEKVTDIFICVSGEATLKVGGTMKNPKTSSPGEVRADAVEGGQSVVMRPGDIVHIPANMPHQLLLKKEFLYFVTKVQEKGPKDAKEFAYYSKADLLGYGPKLKAKLEGKNVATQSLANWGTHSFMVVYRTGDGEAEVHEKQVDYFWILKGATEVMVGGKATEPRTTGPGEIRGKGIEGGEKTAMKAGDLAHIPANTPHQAQTKGELLYAVVKVTQ
ncbi:MAG: hypothetical protein HY821_12210 [Acidobacteria bacterium]|nr:hypothetical protein [Acidobacteriota bacterium]